MSLTILTTSNVEARYHGFIASLMSEISNGVYVSTKMKKGVRLRMWSIIKDWWGSNMKGTIIMIFKNSNKLGGIEIYTLGEPSKTIVDADGFLLLKSK